MARVGYIRCRRKQDIDEFAVVAQADHDKLFIDLVNELGQTGGNGLQDMLSNLSHSATLVIRSLGEIAGDVSELRLFLSTIRDRHVELVLLDSSNNNVLTDTGFETLTIINAFIEEKKRLEEMEQRKLGRKLLTYPAEFLKVYTAYRDGAFNSNNAAKALGINAHRFRELVRSFEA